MIPIMYLLRKKSAIPPRVRIERSRHTLLYRGSMKVSPQKGLISTFRAKKRYFFRKIEISRDSGGVRSSALDMFYTKDSTFDF